MVHQVGQQLQKFRIPSATVALDVINADIFFRLLFQTYSDRTVMVNSTQASGQKVRSSL
jgi:hypothetical protein